MIQMSSHTTPTCRNARRAAFAESLFCVSHDILIDTLSAFSCWALLKCRALVTVSEARGAAYETIFNVLRVHTCVRTCMHDDCIAVSGGLGRVEMFDWATLGKGHVLLLPATPQERSSHRIGFCSKRPKDVLCWSGGSVPPCARPRSLTYSSRGQMGMSAHSAGIRPALQGTRGGMGRPVVGREDLQGTETSLGEVESRSLQSDCSRFGGDGGRQPRAGHAGRRRPQEEEATSLMRSWWGPSDISARLLQHVGRFQTLPGTCCER